VLRQVEEDYSSFVKSQITYYEFLMNAAEHKALTGHREFVERKWKTVQRQGCPEQLAGPVP
jgi:hypothetical protein